MTKNLAIFASGEGTNTENIIRFFQNDSHINVSIVLCDKKDAPVLKRAAKFNIPAYVFSLDEENAPKTLEMLHNMHIDLIVLAGFLKLIPEKIIRKYKNKIINIHPALLPAYGGKGMYGMHVHRAVREAKEKETGISVHIVNEKFDEGEIIFQKKIPVDPDDSPEMISQKVRKLELEFYPKVIKRVIDSE